MDMKSYLYGGIESWSSIIDLLESGIPVDGVIWIAERNVEGLKMSLALEKTKQRPN
jgi:hypothetical protein